MQYRIQVPAVIYFNVEAETPEAALQAAETIRNENVELGWSIHLDAGDSSIPGRAYVDEAHITKPLTDEDIVDQR